MLRRKPTALTVSSEDISAFEEAYARKIAYQKYLKTGEDPNGYFRHGTVSGTTTGEFNFNDHQRTRVEEREDGNGGAIDPNDELKPLPGDKARIIRNREERIMGAGGR